MDDILDIITGRAITPAYQPIYDLRGKALLGYEALARTPTGLTPRQMFALAAGLNLVKELDLLCFQQAIADAPAGGLLFLNIRPSTLIWMTANQLRFPAERVVLELNELERVEERYLERLAQAVARVREHGCRLALDDLSSGYNRLQLVSLLRPDYIKLDGPLVRGCHAHSGRRLVLSSLAQMCAALGVKPVAECIETEAELATVRDLDIPYGQGYYLGCPVIPKNVKEVDSNVRVV